MTTIRNEKWKEIKVSVKGQTTRYAISNLGRIKSFKQKMEEGRLLKGTVVNGYPALKLKIKDKDLQFYIHKLVAEYFVKKGGKNKSYVIHKDHDKLNNRWTNLVWVDQESMKAHQQKSPLVKSYRERTRVKGHKLTASKVKDIKQRIFAKNRQVRLKDIAKKFGISEMQLYRIKSGENWSHIDT